MTDKARSIRHFPAAHAVPDWRNFGVMLRVLLGANLLAALAALVQARQLGDWLDHYLALAALVEPVLLCTLGVLVLARDLLWRLPQPVAQAGVVGAALAVCAALLYAVRGLGLSEDGPPWRALLLTGAASGLLLAYFAWRARAFSPALAEARLAALNARIRPHFLFNSLNAVLSLIRARPEAAETALEGLSDLFRAALRDPGEQVALSDEIALARQYLELERLRLGERLAVDWQIEAIPEDLRIPPLLLQPLLENAVYHGIEPRSGGGTITIGVARQGDLLILRVANPNDGTGAHARGNHMALANIRERLALYYDLEARLEVNAGRDTYEVRLILPCRPCRP